MHINRISFFMKSVMILLLSFTIVFPVTSQKANYDSLYLSITRKLPQTEPEESLKNVDFLYSISKNDQEKIRSLILKAGFLNYYGLNEEAYPIFLAAEKIAQKNEDYISLTRIYGYISSIHRESELFTSALKYLEKASLASGKIEDKDVGFRFKANLEQEKANVFFEKAKHLESIKHARKSLDYLSRLSANKLFDKNYHSVISNGIIFRNYLALNEIDSSFYYLEQAQKSYDKSNGADPTMQGSIFNGYGQANRVIKNYDKAEHFFLQAKEIADETNFFSLKQEVYESLSAFYKELGANEKFMTINEEYLYMINQDKESREQVAEKLLSSLYAQQLIADKNVKSKSKTILYLTLLSFFLAAVLSWYIYNKKQNKKKFEAYINSMNNPLQQERKEITLEPESKKSYISKEKEKSIIDALKELEEKQFYLDQNISLTNLSSQVGVNQRYLTYVIKKKLDADFASYVNKLRIDYIVNCIKTDPQYLNYKISYLASECGFSSHSRFSINFKKVTGTTPSAFINFVKEEMADNNNKSA
ncbi:helix-turn-helix domain-containing protein [Brumimicrobium oceani]|uniref:HTH araC/xylS-type domain-containing protein n=1 Tax=Brumimicrobium oceani TaxID=2100725 RepID=A0A2U2XCD2_9FLAO|nr:AraC family transcriptional regulator [Brumimicrobium oceani]PWH85423.1 hypothetical protein DIT68_09195 [Brumimicrobium oceani]